MALPWLAGSASRRCPRGGGIEWPLSEGRLARAEEPESRPMFGEAPRLAHVRRSPPVSSQCPNSLRTTRQRRPRWPTARVSWGPAFGFGCRPGGRVDFSGGPAQGPGVFGSHFEETTERKPNRGTKQGPPKGLQVALGGLLFGSRFEGAASNRGPKQGSPRGHPRGTGRPLVRFLVQVTFGQQGSSWMARSSSSSEGWV